MYGAAGRAHAPLLYGSLVTREHESQGRPHPPSNEETGWRGDGETNTETKEAGLDKDAETGRKKVKVCLIMQGLEMQIRDTRRSLQ